MFRFPELREVQSVRVLLNGLKESLSTTHVSNHIDLVLYGENATHHLLCRCLCFALSCDHIYLDYYLKSECSVTVIEVSSPLTHPEDYSASFLPDAFKKGGLVFSLADDSVRRPFRPSPSKSL